jgi:AraC family transcriptional regulator of adaptative response/methylated-DNA-[protein]-cysteine methyltransferase
MNARTTLTATERDPRWACVVARDAAADGSFVYSVATTGVYCKPSCASRRARPENVRFHADAAAARAAGFRACKRCRPDGGSLVEEQAALVASACRRIEAAETPPALEDLAREAGLSPFHFHRVFKRIAGVTPKDYAAAQRARRVRAALPAAARVTDALYDAGYGSNGRFYEDSARVLGMTPRSYRAGGERQRIRFALAQCTLGTLLVAASERGVCTIALGDDPETLLRELQDRFPRAELAGGERDFDAIVARVAALVEEPARGFDLPLDIRGTAFQQRVWKALQQIPAGDTASYAEIARRIGAPRSVRAVAQACGANALAIAVPCHRVVRTDGALSGYRWGVERKRALLERESG